MDTDEINERLEDARTSGVGHYCFYVEDKAGISPSNFYWYGSEKELLNALAEDIGCLLIEKKNLKEIKAFNEEMTAIVDSVKRKRTESFFELQKRISVMLQDFKDLTLLEINYIGSYDLLVSGTEIMERVIRNNFRYGNSDEQKIKSPPIKEHEIDEFNEYISNPIESL